MKNAILIALVALVASSTAYAEPPAVPQPTKAAPAAAVPAATPTATKAAAQPTAAVSQQDKMRNCNKEATGKKGAERKAFMKTCLSSKA